MTLTPGETAGIDVRSATTPEQHLVATREALRLRMSRRKRSQDRIPADMHHSTPLHHDQPDPHDRGWLDSMAATFSDVPAAGPAARFVRDWWHRHPMRTTVELASEAANDLARPVAREHPVLLLGGALLAGMVLSRLKPWRWVPAKALIGVFLPRPRIASVIGWTARRLSSLGSRAEIEIRTHVTAPAAREPVGRVYEPAPDGRPTYLPASNLPASPASRSARTPETVPNDRSPALHPSQP